MEKIDVTHTAKPDPQVRRLFLDPATGRREWEVLFDYIAKFDLLGCCLFFDFVMGWCEWEVLFDYIVKFDPQGRRLFLDPATGRREWEVLPDYTAKPDPLGRRLFLDPATRRREWEVLPDYTAKPDPLGRRLFLDGPPNPPCPPATVDAELTTPAFANPALTGATEEYHAIRTFEPATVDAGIAKAAFGMTIEDEKKFEVESRPTKPVKHGRHKANEGDK